MINPPTLKLFDDPDRGYWLTATMEVRRPIEEVFQFFSDAANLETITPPWLNIKILTPMPFEIGKGSLLDYRIQLHYIPIKWRTEISQWQPPHKFTDQQLKGPYKRWHHEHFFEDIGNDITKVIDKVHYIPRGGSLLHKWMVKPDLKKIFEYRQHKLSEIFSDDLPPQA